MNTEQDDGRVGKPTGLSQVEPLSAQGLDPTDFDPSREKCGRCGGPNPPWRAPSPLWNAVMRGGSINGSPIYGDLVCATCFMCLAEEAGIATLWAVRADVVRVSLETVTPSGRVWDDAACLWQAHESQERDHLCDSNGPRMAETPQAARGEAGPARAAEGGIAQADQAEQP